MAKWGEELQNNGEFDPRQMKKQVGYQMRQMFSGKTPEEKNFKPNKEKKDGSFKSANKAIVISKPKEALVGSPGSVLVADVTFLNASKRTYEQGYHVTSLQ